MKESDHIDKIAQYLSGNLPEQEQEQLLQWTKESEENRDLFEEAQKLWELSEQYEEPQYEANIAVAWEQVESRLDPPREQTPGRSISIYRQLFRVAAVLLVAVLAAWWLLRPDTVEVPQMASIQTQTEEVKELVLPDGSQVWLNGDSELTYDPEFAQRRVELKGEAFFDIAHLADQSFEIYTGATKTVVLGTAFNVRAYPQEDKVEVTVIRGKVALTEAQQPKETLLLEAGNAGSYHKTEKTVRKEVQRKVNADSWKTEKLSFDNTQLSEVIQSLERYFNIDIEAANPALLSCHFTGNYSQPQLQQILEVLEFGVNLKVKKDGDRYLLEGKGCE